MKPFKHTWLLMTLCILCSILYIPVVNGQVQDQRKPQTVQIEQIEQIVPGRSNSPAAEEKPYVILISADGFRHDLADKYQAAFLLKMRSAGVAAQSMRPCYPSLTFPNHYAIITGEYPARHGLVDNYFYDRKKDAYYKVGNMKAVRDSSWYGGVPLWVVAERQKMLTASFYWVGSESHIDGVPPTYYYNYTESIPIGDRIQQVKSWLSLPPAERPHFITFYFPQVDHMEHLHGVDAPETAAAVHFVDSSLQALYTACEETGLPINYIFVADHGFANLDTAKTIQPPALDTTRFFYTGGSALMHIYARDANKEMDHKKVNKQSIRNLYKQLKAKASAEGGHYQVYLKAKTPKSWHYRTKDDRFDRIGEILLVADPPYSFYGGRGRKLLGAHGYDNRLPDMQATFYAWGPAFKQHLQIGNFPNVDVYPLIAEILGLKISHPIDGKLKDLRRILSPMSKRAEDVKGDKGDKDLKDAKDSTELVE